MIKIEITDSSVNLREFTRKDTGELLQFREQTAWAHLGGPYPERITLNLGRDQQPYPNGSYQLPLGAVRVNKYQSLEFQRNFQLEPLPASSASKLFAAAGSKP